MSFILIKFDYPHPTYVSYMGGIRRCVGDVDALNNVIQNTGDANKVPCLTVISISDNIQLFQNFTSIENTTCCLQQTNRFCCTLYTCTIYKITLFIQ